MARISSLTWMIALIACLSGCTSTVRVTVEELPKNVDRKFGGLVRPSAVIGVVFNDSASTPADAAVVAAADSLSREAESRKIWFGEHGGTVDLDGGTVAGTTENGTFFSGDFVDLRFIMVKETDVARKFVTPMDLSCDIREVLDNPLKPVKRGGSPCWDVVEFDGAGGHYDEATQTIIGTSKRGTPIVASTDEIICATYKRLSFWKIAKFSATVAVLAAMSNGIFHYYAP